MYFREATTKDIPQLHRIRMAVKENRLNNPLLVQEKDYLNYFTNEGKGWLCEIDGKITGFAIVDIVNDNFWALFVDPAYEANGIGRRLEEIALDWYFNSGKKSISLSTAPDTRAEKFYRNSGWKENGSTKHGELIFEMKAEDWKSKMPNDIG